MTLKPASKSNHPPPPLGFLYSRASKTNLFASTLAARTFIDEFFDNYCEGHKRKLSDKNRVLYKSHFEIILLDLLSAWTADHALWIGYSRGKKEFLSTGRYWNPETKSSPISQRPFIRTIEYLQSCGWVENWIARSGYSNVSSRMRATETLAQQFEAHGLNWTSFSEDVNSAGIIVKNKDKKVISYPAKNDFPLEQAIENLRRINTHLGNTLINLHVSDEEFETIRLQLSNSPKDEGFDHPTKEPIDFSQRRLKRIFANSSFANGGRFYGGWWQHVPSEYRKHIQIESGMTVELDFSTMTPSILYARVSKRPPDDSYALDGWDSELRPVIKKAFNQLLNSNHSSKNPNQWHRFSPDIGHPDSG